MFNVDHYVISNPNILMQPLYKADDSKRRKFIFCLVYNDKTFICDN